MQEQGEVKYLETGVECKRQTLILLNLVALRNTNAFFSCKVRQKQVDNVREAEKIERKDKDDRTIEWVSKWVPLL